MRIACIGTGTIGASWVALFITGAHEVATWDPAPGWQDRLLAASIATSRNCESFKCQLYVRAFDFAPVWVRRLPRQSSFRKMPRNG